MRGLDAWITGNYGEDAAPCEHCEENPQYRRGLCRDCYEAMREDEADRKRDDDEV